MNDRLLNLHMVLKYDSYVAETMGERFRYLSAGQRICINQERSSLMEREFVEKFKQIDSINEKINFIINKLYKSNIYEVYYQNALSIFKD